MLCMGYGTTENEDVKVAVVAIAVVVVGGGRKDGIAQVVERDVMVMDQHDVG